MGNIEDGFGLDDKEESKNLNEFTSVSTLNKIQSINRRFPVTEKLTLRAFLLASTCHSNFDYCAEL